MASAGTEAPLGLPHQSSAFSEGFPLAFRIATLGSLGVFAWALVLHILAKLGIDTAVVLDVRLEEEGMPSGSHFIHPSRFYPPMYRLSLAAWAWTALGMTLYTIFGHAGEGAVGRLLPPAFMVGGLVAFVAPWDRLYRRERFMMLR
jgi:hypothetical protein